MADSFQPLKQQLPGTGDVQANEAPLRFPIHFPAVDEHPPLLFQQADNLCGGKPQSGTIYPDQVGPLQRHHTELRQTFGQHIADNLVIPVKVELQFLQPFLPAVISRFQGIHGKGIDVTHLIDVDGLVNLLPDFFIRRDDIGYLNARQIKRLAGGNTGDGV